MANADPQTGYAPVNGLEMYYEVQGTGEPLVLLHGAYMTIDAMGELVPGLAETRQMIAVEQQGHGRTADIDRPITYEQMADDTAALLRHLGIGQADVFGFSMGGGIALQLAIRYPSLVRKLVSVSASYTSDGMQPELHEMVPGITPQYLEALDWRDHSIVAWEKFFESWDVLLCLTSMVTAFSHRETGSPLRVDGQEVAYWLVNAHTTLFNYTGHPAVVLPYTEDRDGLPIGVQVVGKRWDESRLLGAAYALSQVTGKFQRPPGY